MTQSDTICRYRTLFLWPHADQALLDARLDKRVDAMIEVGEVGLVRRQPLMAYKQRGLLREVQALHDVAQQHPEFDQTTGIFQVLGKPSCS